MENEEEKVLAEEAEAEIATEDTPMEETSTEEETV